MRVYAVGGSVRDELLGLDPTDNDWVVVGATPEEMIARGYKGVGSDFPVFLHPESQEEYALARQERKTGPGHKGFETAFSPEVTLEDDLSRRDLTINAMAKDPESGALIDPFNGQADLRAKILRHVSEAFSEDPLRVLRLARFQAKTQFSIAPETWALCQQICRSGALAELSFERVRVELVKMLAHPNARLGMQTLKEMGALDSFEPGWGSRLTPSFLDALDRASQSPLPLVAKTAFLFGALEAKPAQDLLERLKFSSEEQRFCSRLMAARSLVDSLTRPAEAPEAVEIIERLGLSKSSCEQAEPSFRCLEILAAISPSPFAVPAVSAARKALDPYRRADISSAMSFAPGAKRDGAEIGRRVAALRLLAVEEALRARKPANPKPF